MVSHKCQAEYCNSVIVQIVVTLIAILESVIILSVMAPFYNLGQGKKNLQWKVLALTIL
jgi:hypothetical protein